MPQLDTRQKLAILADAAKYDASCASSGTAKRDSSGGKGIGSIEGMGICHAYAPDGRCISLLKILLTNSCIFDCHYCLISHGCGCAPTCGNSPPLLPNSPYHVRPCAQSCMDNRR